MSLIQEFLLNESGSTNTISSSLNGTTGWIAGTTTANANVAGPGGLYQRALSFNGSDRQVNFTGHPLSGYSKYSIVCFASMTQTGVSYPMIVAGDTAGVEIRMVGTSLLPEFAINGPVTTSFSGAPITTGQYNMFTLTFDGSTVRGYTNNIISPATIFTTGIALTLAPNLRIATREVGNFRYNGRIAAVQFYDYALGIDDIVALYNKSIPYLNNSLTISGNSNSGGVLTGMSGSWTDGTQNIRWYRNLNETFEDATPITSATNSTYTITSGDAGYYIFFGISGTNTMGSRRAGSNPISVGGVVMGTASAKLVENNNITVSHGGRRSSTFPRKDNNLPNTFLSETRYRNRFNDYSYYTTHSGY